MGGAQYYDASYYEDSEEESEEEGESETEEGCEEEGEDGAEDETLVWAKALNLSEGKQSPGGEEEKDTKALSKARRKYWADRGEEGIWLTQIEKSCCTTVYRHWEV